MKPALIAIAVLVVVVLAGLVVRRRRPENRMEGVDSFRRHMDALSSDSRRDVIDRVRDAQRDPEEQ